MAERNSRAINHIAVSVADINAVTKWYTEVMGFHVHGGMIKHIKRSETPDASIFDIYGDSLNECKIAWMATGNGVGFEVFEFVDPKFEPAKTFEYNRGGFFHLCVTDSNPDALVDKVVKHGGKRIGKTIRNTLSRSICLYCKDPWGNILEILDMSFDQMAALDTCSPSDLNARHSKL
ncbi:unnamed protein product [Clonostachys rhizophaga]|uniref:VOC domain-containing protein n=1 Tax=Clonostachys rhizophaga TaxID=160324 RepID=A0A9N9W2W3_9HYPO|nr:unnamed protein product [Clonostachys rhizophaga]